jgi:hypothetical protein
MPLLNLVLQGRFLDPKPERRTCHYHAALFSFPNISKMEMEKGDSENLSEENPSNSAQKQCNIAFSKG